MSGRSAAVRRPAPAPKADPNIQSADPRTTPPRKKKLGFRRRSLKPAPDPNLSVVTDFADRSGHSPQPTTSPSPYLQDRLYDPLSDDVLDPRSFAPSAHAIAPTIQVRPEFSSVSRTSERAQPLTCILTVELPKRRDAAHGPERKPRSPKRPSTQQSLNTHNPRSDIMSIRSASTQHTPSVSDTASSHSWAFNPTPKLSSPFAGVTADLDARVVDWKGHPRAALGPLQMYDLLRVRRDADVREFNVYLFKHAIICVSEDKKRGLGRLLSPNGDAPRAQSSKTPLRLKGRIFIHRIRSVAETSFQGELSLTIDMDDERLDSFVLVFRDRGSLEAWRTLILKLVEEKQRQNAIPDANDFGIVSTSPPQRPRLRSGSTSSVASQTDSLAPHHSLSSGTSQHPLSEESDAEGVSRAALPHTPLDLIVVASLPPPHAPPSTAALKRRVVKDALEFVAANLGPRDRLSLVTFDGSAVHRTPYLFPGNARLERFIDGVEHGANDEFVCHGEADEERAGVVAAVDRALDVVLRRKTRNPVSGMILVSDAADSTRKAEMDAMLDRGAVASMPIHSFGFGLAHDPAALWLMSNHTGGTYTFVKEWFDLRACLAGCVGGLMSVALLGARLRLSLVDGARFRVRKVAGVPGSTVAGDGCGVDMDVGELRYGERREMLIELELDNTVGRRPPAHRADTDPRSATDEYVSAMGLDALDVGDMDLADGMMDTMIEEVPVFEVDGAFFDPAAGRHVAHLARPALLNMTLLPRPPPGAPPPPRPASDPAVVRRRMELLASDMVTRALVLVSRANVPQAQRIFGETRRILQTVLQSVTQRLPAPTPGPGGGARNRRETLLLAAVRVLQSISGDIQALSDALAENAELFGHDQRNFGAQQAMVLRDQRSWTDRTPTEKLFMVSEHAQELVLRSQDWAADEE